MSLVPQLVHLEPGQKKELARRKYEEGAGSYSEQVRLALDNHLNGNSVESEELAIAIDLAKEAEKTIKQINEDIERQNQLLDKAFQRLDALRANP